MNQYNDFIDVQIGQTFNEVTTSVPELLDVQNYTLNSNGQTYKIYQDNIYTFFRRRFDGRNPATGANNSTTDRDVSRFYFVFDENNRLFYMGYPFEFKQSDNVTVADLGNKLYEVK
ncbi:MAG: hypothetical protein Kapaf2KO_23580 [Candidatus Kapaibacteriales bacterium]